MSESQTEKERNMSLCLSVLPDCYPPLFCRCHGYSALSPPPPPAGGYGGMGLERRGGPGYTAPASSSYHCSLELPPLPFSPSFSSTLLSHPLICTLLDLPAFVSASASVHHTSSLSSLPFSRSLCWRSLFSVRG